MRGATWTRKLRSAAASGAILAGAGAATALGWSGWVETETVSGATNAQPPALPAAGAPTARPALRQASVLVCQATGDGGYVLVRVLSERLAEYRSNPNNLVPAPKSGCPSSVADRGGSIPATTTPPTQPPATTSSPAAPAPRTPPTTTSPRTTPTSASPRPTPPGARDTSTAPRAATASGETPSLSVSPVTARDEPAPRRTKTFTGKLPANLERLPNTGNETALLLFFGADLLLLGAGLRLRSRRSVP